MRFFLTGLLALPFTQCATVEFYSQAIAGHREVMRNRRPLQDVIHHPSTPPELKRRLNVVQELRQFADSELGLPSAGQYDRYTDLGREHLVWVVFATPELSMEPRSWSYPLVGRLKYRGYFSERDALKLAKKLQKEGNDVHISEVDAYSTLGWFADPVLNTFIDEDDTDLAELIFHELTHQRLYVGGDTEFDEALATAVGQEGTRRWLQHSGRHKELEAYNRQIRLLNEFLTDIRYTRLQLASLFDRIDLSDDEKRQVKTHILLRFRQRADAMNRRHGGSLKIAEWFAKPVNNARLNSIATYYDRVPDFTNLLAHHHGDLDAFFLHVKETRRMNPAERREWLIKAIDKPSLSR